MAFSFRTSFSPAKVKSSFLWWGFIIMKQQKHHIRKMLESRLVSYDRVEERVNQMEIDYPHHDFQRYRDRLREYRVRANDRLASCGF